MALLIRIVLIAATLFLLRYLIAAFIGRNKKRAAGGQSTGVSTHMVKDPVCGMYLDSRLAVRLENRNETYYFCSEGCKAKFLNLSSGK